jgi:hypothetical protein
MSVVNNNSTQSSKEAFDSQFDAATQSDSEKDDDGVDKFVLCQPCSANTSNPAEY